MQIGEEMLFVNISGQSRFEFHSSNILNGLLIRNGLVAILGHRVFQNVY
jgi:hypothetical protein